jgi:ferredoxin
MPFKARTRECVNTITRDAAVLQPEAAGRQETLRMQPDTSANAEACGSFKVTVADNGESYTCLPTESALHSLARSGRKGIPVGCRGGGCGVCKVAVLQGDYTRKPMSRAHISAQDEAEQRVLACCILPQSDLVLQVIGKLNKAVTRPA